MKTIEQFRADRKILTDPQAIANCFTSMYGMHWEVDMVDELASLHAYTWGYWVAELKTGDFFVEIDGVETRGTLEVCEKALYEEYIK